MKLHEVSFIGSFPTFAAIPPSKFPEICFWGRSNVGKSSLVNLLCNRKELAKVSGRPGKTRAFVQYQVDHRLLFMDLPGYGYARVSKKEIARWTVETEKYLQQRKNIFLLFLLVDASIEPQQIDLEKMRYLGEIEVPFYLVLTKTDKCSMGQLTGYRQKLKDEMLEDWNAVPPMIAVSATKNQGREEIFTTLGSLLGDF
ncbi:MAG: YihA family ribosome biogenesis GTP-binding protein [Saprospiraceae bacterium]|nr:YihA family ribosome biogenesis GTP-binding protein [Saprospiraceae bacterium]